MNKINIMLDKGAFEPVRAHAEDAGMDLRTPKECVIPAHGSVCIDTGVHIEIPRGHYGKLEGKSGLHIKHDIVCLGGVIDAGYCSSMVVKLYNLGDVDYTFFEGDKIVQLIIQPCETPEVVEVDSFAHTDRGNGGFGSTGR